MEALHHVNGDFLAAGRLASESKPSIKKGYLAIYWALNYPRIKYY